MIIKEFWFRGVEYNIYIGNIGFGFIKYSFKKTSMTFLWDWYVRLGIIGLQKWQSKDYKELKKMSDKIWNEIGK